MNCGVSLASHCSNCQAELLPGARFCMHCGQAIRAHTSADDARLTRLAAATPPPLADKVRAAAHLAGERRYVTVLFIDVVGSTGLAEELDVEVWSVLMNGAFDRLVPVIYRYEGTIARMLGDSLVAFFGAPVAHEDDPLRAVMAALDVIQVAEEYAGIVRQQYGVEFAMRACLNYGLVMMGSVDKDLKYDFTSLGGVINLAARLKFAAQPMSVLITDTVHRFVSPVFDCIDVGIIEVKGRSEPVRAYQVLGYQVEPGSLRGLTGLESPMVGRDRELARLVHLCETVRAGLGRAVLIIGEPGMGKTRLIAEWQAAVVRKANLPSVQWAEGHSHSYAQGLVYHLLIHLVYSLLGVSESTGEAKIHSALRSLVGDLYENPDASPGLEVYTLLANLLSLKLEGDALKAVEQVETEALPVRYAFALRSLVERLAARRPVVLVLEDLHWADPSSVEVLIRLLPLVTSAQVLFCMVTRPDREAAGWKLVTAAREALGISLSELTLEALTDLETRQLVANLLAIEALPEELRALILKKSEGNPYFVEEIIRMMIEHEAITPVDGGWVAGEALDSLVVPDNLQGLLMARIDRLPDEGRHTLRVASVVGRQFPVRVLEWVLADGSTQVVGAPGAISVLSSLENAGLVRLAAVEPDLEYYFRHTLVQEAAYASLLLEDRKRLHLAVGRAVESLYPNRLDENAAVLARHYYEAGDQELALHYFTLAGQSALDSYANQEAEGHHRMALSLARQDSQRAELLSGLGQAICRQGRIPEGIRVWMEAIGLYQASHNYDGVAQLYSRAARASWHDGDTPAGLRYCQEGLKAVREASESREMARLIHETARAYFFNGMPDQADQFCRQALEMAERLGAVEVQADTLATLGVLRNISPDEAVVALEKAVEISEANQLLRVAVRAHINLSTARRGLFGDNLAALDHIKRAVEVARRRGVPQEILLTEGSLLWMYFDMGELAEVERILPEIEKILVELPDPDAARGDLGQMKAGLLALRGDWQAAFDLMRFYLNEAIRRGDLQSRFNASSFLAMTLLEYDCFVQAPDWSEVEQLLQDAIDIGERGIGESIGPRCRLSVAHARRHNFQEAWRWLNEARSKIVIRSSIWQELFLLIAEAELARAEGRWDDAISAYQKQVEIHSRTHQRLDWARALQNLAEVHALRSEAEDLLRAHSLFNLALDLYKAMGASVYVRAVEERLLSLQVETESQVMAARKVSQDMVRAGKIQGSFLPEEIPQPAGWSLAAVLEPALQTSGDYYDFIPLPEGLLGVVIADVTDKGAGAALYMASSRTLVRTYADLYPSQPEAVVNSVNRRLLLDTHSGLYITIFYGILNPGTGVLVYCNAGHNPPHLYSNSPDRAVRSLPTTGMAIGILPDVSWTRGQVQLEPGEALVLYTDGVSEAQDKNQASFGEARLSESVCAHLRDESDQLTKADELLRAVLEEIHQFVGGATRSDDLTLIVIRRDP